MALDASTLALTARELKATLAEGRIDKIYQPTRDEVLFLMHNRQGNYRLLLCARTGTARVCLTEESFENPAAPPSFCMLLRKYLTGGRLTDIRTIPGERIVFFDLLCTNEMGDLVQYCFAAELMGRYCNLVLVRGLPALDGESVTDESGEPLKIVDALKRVDFEDSEVRQILPNLPYTLPPRIAKPNLMQDSFEAVFTALSAQGELPVPDALRKISGTAGPVVTREICHRAFAGLDMPKPAAMLTQDEKSSLEHAIYAVRQDFEDGGKPNMAVKEDGTPAEFSFTRLTQYLPICTIKEFDGFSLLLEAYYAEKDKGERMKQKSKALRKTVQTLYDRAVRRQAARKEDLQESESSDGLRITGELLTASLHTFKKGDTSVTLQDWYTGENRTIKLDARLTPSQNAQKYFKDYKKKQTAAKMLAQLLKQGEVEIEYLKTVLYEVDTAETEAAFGEIRAELKQQGYLKYYKHREKKQKPAGFLRYKSSDGFAIYVGRNNAQNEKLTLKTARGKDLWFHTKNAPGSHVVVMSEGNDIPLATQNEAAMLAVYHSSLKNGSKIPVDYTHVKNIRKTNDLPPGMVLYDHYETAYITPDEKLIEGLASE